MLNAIGLLSEAGRCAFGLNTGAGCRKSSVQGRVVAGRLHLVAEDVSSRPRTRPETARILDFD